MAKSYTGQQQFLLQSAQRYTDLGYKIGLAKGKEFLGLYQPDSVVSGWFGMPIKTQQEQPSTDFNAISLIPDGVVCVDFDEPDFGLVWEPLPPTWKERTPRGWHLFYYLDPEVRDQVKPKVKWRASVDLLVVPGKDIEPDTMKSEQLLRYNRKKTPDQPNGGTWARHVLISRSDGYKLVWPDEVPPLSKLTPAPDWLVQQLIKP